MTELAMAIDSIRMTRRNGVPREVDYRLTSWAHWEHSPDWTGGFPTRSVTERAAEYGRLGLPQESNYKPPQQMPKEIQEIDDIVSAMPGELRTIILAHYTTWLPFTVKAQQCRMSPSKFRSKLEAAQWYVYARLQS